MTTTMTNAGFVDIDRVDLGFPAKGGRQKVVSDFSFAVAEGEVVCLIGHSGCGKTTLLNAIAGLLPPDGGTITCAGRPVTGPGPDRGVVFQNHALLPWMTCFDNVHLGVRHIFGHSESRTALVDRTNRALAMVRLSEASQKYPAEISGGMKQRVGIARALAMEPKVLLLDEPFGALDARTRTHLQDTVMGLHQKLGNTVMMITHDVDEAVLLSDRIVMMTNGPSARIGEVLDITLERPRSRLDLVDDPTYVRLRAAVLEFLYSRHAAPHLHAAE